MYLKYLAYNLFKVNKKTLHQFVNQLHKERNIPKAIIYKNIALHFFRWDTMLLDYFFMRFFEEKTDVGQYATIWDLYRFHMKFNGKEYIVFRDKLQFRKRFSNYITYPFLELKTTKDLPLLIDWIETNRFEKIVAKKPMSSGGKDIEVLAINRHENKQTIAGKGSLQYLELLFKRGYKLFEAFIEQHATMATLSPTSVNTVRIVTFLNNSQEVEIWATIVRIGLGKSLDNFSMGGLAANVDAKTGVINSFAKLKDPFCTKTYHRHPVTDAPITGVSIPFWADILTMVEKAALEIPSVRTVGWDIALTRTGPTLIEGNDNWGKTIVELVTGKGLKRQISNWLGKNPDSVE